MSEKKYTLDQIAICNWEQIHVFPKAQARKLDGLLFCSKQCKDGYIRDTKFRL